MPRVGVTYVEPTTGARSTHYFDVDSEDADSIGDTLTTTVDGVFNAQTFAAIQWQKNFAPWPTAAMVAGWSVEPADSLRRLYLIAQGQSNICRGFNAGAAAIRNPDLIAPNAYPFDENAPDGATRSVGFTLGLADELADAIRAGTIPYDVIVIVSTSSGSSSLASLYGTDGTDGIHRAQLNIGTICQGVEGSNPPCFLIPGSDYLILHSQGEDDAQLGTAEATWASGTEDWWDSVQANDFPSSTCKGILMTRLAPTSPNTGTYPQANWDAIRSGAASLADAGGTPPVYVFDWADADQEPTDKVHYTAAAQDDMGRVRMLATAIDLLT